MQDQDINSLLAKYFNDEILPDERLVVEEWISANQQEYRRLKSLMDQARDTTVKPSFDVASGWKQVDAQIRGGVKTVKLETKPAQHKWWLSIAASLFLITSFALIYYSSYYNPLITISSGDLANKQIKLEDGTIVTLNANSRLQYFKQLASDKRQVKLEGEAFFEVTKNPARPFIIEAGQGKVKVLGTSFNVNTDSSKVEVVVRTGKVQLSSNANRALSITLLPGNRGLLNGENLVKDTVLSENGYAWKTGMLVFRNEQMNTLVKVLEHTYHRKIIMENADSSCAVTATFKDQSLDSVLKELKLLLKFDYEVKKDYILIHNLACGNDKRQ
ncbi:FecR domain-containing protein [Pedobacter cryoconitis]|uniref:Ferric-dicitrate binding protein FerR (Iron transport regulator) n=1 Tax=Pedobacter cryoconitis TaxID=188932 RepID=A0A7X0J3T6_9SPHI|nr:FecR domain-containing protein [Pedobacter cryoconitis]MBB6499272.1 ferric-dicitrate binding protein FerR (iron transport regulator) [Pedobacter cryoconitis]